MDQERPKRAWLLMAAGDNRGHGGNSGYDDQFDAHYSWDSNVPNHKKLKVGDPIALWDKDRLLGASVIEQIDTTHGTKLLYRCPACSTTRISERKRADPRYRCMRCRQEFSTPEADLVEVVLYRARYDAAWASLDGLLEGQQLRSLAVHPGDINAMRPLDWAAFRRALLHKDARRAVDRVSLRSDLYWQSTPGLVVEMASGFTHALVRVRRGQEHFRERLLATQGSVCAFTGRAPARVLEAGHLYSYAQIGTHFEHGGLMLRRDIHRLFDDGMLAVDPGQVRIDVDPELAAYPQYAQLHGETLALKLRGEQVEWLGKHWEEHRAGSSGHGHSTSR